MRLHTLKPAQGSIKKEKRIGRGEGSGHGGTSTRGHKGAQSRSGYKRKRGFEGGQMPLQRRVPKFGFKNPFRVEYRVFNLNQLEDIATKNNLKSIDIEVLRKHKFIQQNDLVKVLGRGEIKSAIEVKAHAFSETAKKAIETAGGTAHTI
ncbi:MAG TPA: 50S ribosomal protein L15 [Bacteroidia bacterium]|nr:50S ribosomal protein L15 [Bacteroidia bacterium]